VLLDYAHHEMLNQRSLQPSFFSRPSLVLQCKQKSRNVHEEDLVCLHMRPVETRNFLFLRR